jgi:carbohydrate kinase (thermoresistant glucokinase family)
VIVVVMGVSGVGKTTIGAALAQQLGWRFLDADDYHPPENVAKMAAGTPLTDADRRPWLEAINRELWKSDSRNEDLVLACSALKEAYRRRLLDGISRYEVVFLNGDRDLIRARLSARRHRYMPATLLESQFAALEPPARGIEINVTARIADCVDAIVARLDR